MVGCNVSLGFKSSEFNEGEATLGGSELFCFATTRVKLIGSRGTVSPPPLSITPLSTLDPNSWQSQQEQSGNISVRAETSFAFTPAAKKKHHLVLIKLLS